MIRYFVVVLMVGLFVCSCDNSQEGTYQPGEPKTETSKVDKVDERLAVESGESANIPAQPRLALSNNISNEADFNQAVQADENELAHAQLTADFESDVVLSEISEKKDPTPVTNKEAAHDDQPVWQPLPGKQLTGLQGEYRVFADRCELRWSALAHAFGYRLEAEGATLAAPSQQWWSRDDDDAGQEHAPEQDQASMADTEGENDVVSQAWSREISIPFTLTADQAILTIVQIVEPGPGLRRRSAVGLIRLGTATDPTQQEFQRQQRTPIEVLPDGRRLLLPPAK